ncbi:MAG: hypothetical protein H7268_15065 [Sandarakinorhabdus sp.]|nr:hypothetical protein [Sandarakinorhabdus sp.]
MISVGPRFAAACIALLAILAALWLVLFAGPALLNSHRDGATLLAGLVYLGVPTGLAWGARALVRLFDPKDHDDE